MILARWSDMNLPTGTVTVPTGSSATAASRERRAGCLEINGWTARRHEVIERDSASIHRPIVGDRFSTMMIV
jgi:hypothetical protein